MNESAHSFSPDPAGSGGEAHNDNTDPGMESHARDLPERSFTFRQLIRLAAVFLMDFTAVALTLCVAFLLKQGFPFGDFLSTAGFVIGFAAIASACFVLSGLYSRSWRFVNFSHSVYLGAVVLASLALAWAVTLFLPALRAMGSELIPVTIVHWALATVSLLGMRMARRAYCEWRDRRQVHGTGRSLAGPVRTAIVIASSQWARVSIDMANTQETSLVRIAGVLLPQRDHTLRSINNVPVLGSQHDLAQAVDLLSRQGIIIEHVVVCDDGTYLGNRDITRIIHMGRELGLEVSRVHDPLAQLLQHSSHREHKKVPVEALLGRSECDLDSQAVLRQVAGSVALVTGAGGTIGSELCWQIAGVEPAKLVLVDNSEFNLYTIEAKLRESFPDLDIAPEIVDVRDKASVNRLFSKHSPSMVYHAAALKHVPIVEGNACAGAMTNIIGTRNIADAVCEYSAKAMVQVSSDKAVNPIGAMGATKRVGELYSQALDLCGVDDPDAPRFMTVRFGNVLGSSGSIVPLFERQLKEGRPLTVTHPDIERYFMTVREAVQLILQSSSAALEQETRRGSIFVLDMGDPVRIVDLARRMITLYGLEPEVDVPIEFVGLRPGEKLYEELFDGCEERLPSEISGIFEARSRPIPLPLISMAIDRLNDLAAEGEDEDVKHLSHSIARYPAGDDKAGILALILNLTPSIPQDQLHH